MKLCLYLDPSQSRHWIKRLMERLLVDQTKQISIVWSKPIPLPARISKLLSFELGYCHKGQTIGSSPLDVGVLDDLASPSDEFDLVIDCVGDGKAPNAARSVTVLFNAHTGEQALVASIMNGGLPQIALRDNVGEIVATAQPSAELAIGVSGSMDQVFARLITLLIAWIDQPKRWVQPLQDQKAALPASKTLIVCTAKSLLITFLMKVYYMFFRPSHWRVGWRWVSDQDVWTRRNLAGEPWQVLEDEETHFYADPVPWEKDGKHYLFFEDLDHFTQKGILAVVEFDENGKPGPTEPCLEEDYHLSYPYLIEYEGETYMIPETSGNRDVALYKATNFPFGWERHKVIMSDIDAADVTITQQDGKWWIFCTTRDGGGGYSDCLSIFYADDLFGPWSPHAQNPVLIDKATARPAGNFVEQEGKLLRPVQDCTTSYGASMNLVEVTKLTAQEYEQKVVTHLGPDGHWPGRKLHTLNRAGQLEVVDGVIVRPRSAFLRQVAERIYRPAGSK